MALRNVFEDFFPEIFEKIKFKDSKDLIAMHGVDRYWYVLGVAINTLPPHACAHTRTRTHAPGLGV